MTYKKKLMKLYPNEYKDFLICKCPDHLIGRM